MKRSIFIGIAVLLATVACSNREHTVTGDMGSKRVAGEIVLAQDLQGSSRGGIEVRVEGTGLSVLTGPDGRFDLFGAPESDIRLLFHRESDGVDASVTISGSDKSNLLIELGRHSASRRRGVGHPGVEIEGVIKDVSATSITVTDGNGNDRTAVIDTTTIIRKGNTTLTAADLTIGEQVHVKAKWNTDGVTMTAVEIKVQDETQGGGEGNNETTVEIEGTVVSVTAPTLTVFDSHRQTDTITTDANTVIRKGQTTVQLTDLRQGDRVHVKATKATDGTLTATLIIVQNTNDMVELNGIVTNVGTDSLTFTTNQTQSITVSVTSDTKIRKGSSTIALSDIQVGNRVEVTAQKSSTGLTATVIHVESMPD